MVSLIAATDLRVGGLLALRWGALNLDVGSLEVRESVYGGTFQLPKTQRALRTILLGPHIVKALVAHRDRVARREAVDLVFGNRKGGPLRESKVLTKRRWRKTARCLAPSNRPRPAGSWRRRKWAVCTTATIAWPRSHSRQGRRFPPAHISPGCRVVRASSALRRLVVCCARCEVAPGRADPRRGRACRSPCPRRR